MAARPTLQCGPALHDSVDLRIQTYTEPVSLKYGKLATKCPWMYGCFFTVCEHIYNTLSTQAADARVSKVIVGKPMADISNICRDCCCVDYFTNIHAKTVHFVLLFSLFAEHILYQGQLIALQFGHFTCVYKNT